MTEYTQVRLRRSTCQRLKTFGSMGDSYDKVINKLMDNSLLQNRGEKHNKDVVNTKKYNNK